MRPFARHGVAAFVLFHLIAITLGATPSVRVALSRAAWKDPVVQGELGQWVRRLNQVGYTTTPAEFEQDLWDLAVGWTSARETVVRPFYPYLDLVGARQPWRLFTAPHRFPSRIEIAVRRRGFFEDVYVARSDEHAWQRRRLDDVRFRKAIYLFGWPNRLEAYEGFTRWVAREAARDFTDADYVRVRFYRYETPSPAWQREGKAKRGQYRFERVLELKEYR